VGAVQHGVAHLGRGLEAGGEDARGVARRGEDGGEGGDQGEAVEALADGAVHVGDHPGAARLVGDEGLRGGVRGSEGTAYALGREAAGRRHADLCRPELDDDAVGGERRRGERFVAQRGLARARRLVEGRALGERGQEMAEVSQGVAGLTGHQGGVGREAADEAEGGRRGQVVDVCRVDEDRHGVRPPLSVCRPRLKPRPALSRRSYFSSRALRAAARAPSSRGGALRQRRTGGAPCSVVAGSL